MRTIEMVVSPDGETRIETRGFAGPECVAATRHLEAALGHKAADQLTGEFFQTAQEPATQRLTAGDDCT
jgi:hypothetical protein